MLDTIIYSIIFVVFAALAIDGIRLRRKVKYLVSSVLQGSLEKNILTAELAKALTEKENGSIEQTDGFLKFVTQSRDWAFQYIEESQAALQEFMDVVGPHLKTYEASKKDSATKTEVIKKISEAYGKLIVVMPKENIQTDSLGKTKEKE